MSRWATFCKRSVIAVAALAVLLLPALASAKPGDPLMDYGADLVTDYVFRGQDIFEPAYSKTSPAKTPSSFHMSPAIQPYLTLYGPAGFSFGMWSSWALTDRKANTSTGFAGLGTLDEIDYTLGWSWSNKMGDFGAGLVSYTNTNSGGSFGSEEMYLTYTAPIALSPTFSRYVVPTPSGSIGGGSAYTSVSVGGGDKLTWKVNVGQTTALNDVTATVGYPVGPLSVSFNVSDRPNLPSGSTDKAAIFWLDINYSGSVTE